MQAPPSHLYYVHWIYRSCSYFETSPIGLQYYHNSGSVDIISCYLWLYGRDLRTGPATVSRDDMMSWCHGVIVMSSDMITSRKLDSSNISYHRHHHCLWWLQCICFCLIISWLPPSHSPLSSVQSTLVSALDPLLPPTPGHSPLPANCQPRVPVDHSALCPAAAISHPKKPLLLPPPSLLKSAIWSQDRCPLYKLCPGWPCPLDRPVEFYIFSPKIC